MFVDGLYEALLAGGWVLMPIFLVGAGAFYILLGRMHTIGTDFYRRNFTNVLLSFREQLNGAKRPFGLKYRGLSYDLVAFIAKNRNLSYQDAVNELKNYLARIDRELESGMYLVGVFAAAAPLLGLLGTVGGMVRTFETITLYGNSNPVLMAEGISEALITTQSGLVIAFPVILLKHRVEDKIVWIKKQLQRIALEALAEIYKERES